MIKSSPDVTHIIRYTLENASRVQSQVAIDGGRVIENVKFFDFSLLRKVGEEAQEGEVFVFHQQSMSVNALYFEKKFGGKNRVVYDVHDLLRFIPTKKYFLKKCLFFLVISLSERLVFESSIRVLTVSKGLKKILSKQYGRSPVICYSVGCAKPTHFPAPCDNKQHSNLIYFGTMSDERTPLEVFERIGQLGASVDFYGRLGGSKKFKEKVRSLEKNEFLFYCGPYQGNEITKIAANYKASLLIFKVQSLNLRYAMPNKLFQSFLAGIPCIVSDGMTEIEKEFSNLDVVRKLSDYLRQGKLPKPERNPRDIYWDWLQVNRSKYRSFLINNSRNLPSLGESIF